MSYRYERRRSRVGCLAWLVAIVWILLLALLAYRFLLREPVSQFIGQQIGQQLRSNIAAPPGGQIPQGAENTLPTVIAGLPAGQLRISEAQANAYLAANTDALQPIDSATVRFVPGEIQADITALGTTSTARMGVAVQDGRLIAVNPRIDGLLAQFIAADDLTNALERQINDQLAAQGRRATDVRVEQGQLIVTLEG
jgi:hypothetical protein